jgi:polar amino acid transport system substrate-binding protein
MTKLAALALLVFGAALFPNPAQAQGKRVITIATHAAWPPMEFIDNQNQITGFSVEYMRAAAQAAGYEIKIVNSPWDGIFAGLLNNKYDAVCSSLTITAERQKSMNFSIPYFSVYQAVIVPKDSQIKSLDDLKGRRAGSQNSTTGTLAIQRSGDIESVTFDAIGLALEDLAQGRLDAVVCDSVVAAYFVLHGDEYRDQFKIAALIKPDTGQELYGVAVRKGDLEILDLINKGIETVNASGQEAGLIQKWIEGF